MVPQDHQSALNVKVLLSIGQRKTEAMLAEAVEEGAAAGLGDLA